MVFRVTNIQTTNSFIDQINGVRTSLDRTRQKISSGFDVLDPSDDAGRAGTIATLQNTSQRLESHKDRIVFATNFLDAQENAISNAEEVMIRLKELATQSANGSISFEVRDQMADEVFQLRETLASLANTKYQGLFIFGGNAQGTAPFAEDTAYFNPPAAGSAPERAHFVFQRTVDGITGTRSIDISDNDSIRINTPGNTVFEAAIDAATRLGRALTGHTTVVDAADGDGDGNTTELANAQAAQLNLPQDYALQTAEILSALDDLEAARVNDLEVELSSIGARVNRLQLTTEILDTLITNTEQARAAVQDTDVFEAATQFTNLQTNLEALLASGSRINNLSLLNFI